MSPHFRPTKITSAERFLHSDSRIKGVRVTIAAETFNSDFFEVLNV
jgi:hypothetical protein